MAKAIYVKFDTPEELANQAEEALKTAQDSGKVAKGTNEVTKFIERETQHLLLSQKMLILLKLLHTSLFSLMKKKFLTFTYLLKNKLVELQV